MAPDGYAGEDIRLHGPLSPLGLVHPRSHDQQETLRTQALSHPLQLMPSHRIILYIFRSMSHLPHMKKPKLYFLIIFFKYFPIDSHCGLSK